MPQKVVMVTGGTRGIGAAICERLLADGCALSVGVRPGRELPDHLAKAPASRVMTCDFDARDRSTHGPWVEETARRFGGIDGLVNNAGIDGPAMLHDADEAALDDLWAVNAKTPLHLIQLALPHLRRSGRGRIVNIASLSGKRVKNANVGYAMTKFALVALTHTVRQQEWDNGIRCSVVCPGFVLTDMTAEVTKVRREDMIRPEDVAAAVALLIDLPNTASISEIPINCRAEDIY